MSSPQQRTTNDGTSQAQPSAAAGGRTEPSAASQASGRADPGHPEQARAADYGHAEQHGSAAAATGIVLAGILMILAGLLAFLSGLSAVVKSAFYAPQTNYAYHLNVHAWGWINLIVGLLVLGVGVCLLMGMTWARITAVALVVISVVASFLYLPYYPVWSIVVIAIDVFVLWALIHGNRDREPA